jgi:hypothetical protein
VREIGQDEGGNAGSGSGWQTEEPGEPAPRAHGPPIDMCMAWSMGGPVSFTRRNVIQE